MPNITTFIAENIRHRIAMVLRLMSVAKGRR
jgi:hypothetical protein